MPRNDPEARKAYDAAYYAAHREERRAYNVSKGRANKAKYRASPKGKARIAAYDAAHPRDRRAYKAAYNAAYYAANREAMAAYKAAYYAANRGALLARDRERDRAKRMAEAVEYLRSGPKSYLDGVLGNRLTKQQKLEAMAAQTDSPREALIAQQKLEVLYGS